MSAHTAGPWTVGGRIAGLREDHVAISGGRDFACAVMQGNYETDSANARLIAAAPDLLAALKEAIEWCHMGHGDFPARGCGLCKPMHAAIAKAEGR